MYLCEPSVLTTQVKDIRFCENNAPRLLMFPFIVVTKHFLHINISTGYLYAMYIKLNVQPSSDPGA